MAKIDSFKDLDAWQAAMEVAERCYRLTKRVSVSRNSSG